MRAITWIALLGVAASLAYLLYAWYARQQATARLAALLGVDLDPPPRHDSPASGRSFPPRYRMAAPLVGVTVALLAALTLGVVWPIAIALGAVVGVLTSLVEAHIAEQKEAVIETQLAAAIDLLVGSLRAGSSLLAAFESALQEAEAPLKPYLQEVAGRIRLGDDPRAAVSDLQHRVPLETFRLFATSLAIHWEVGGSLATTLGTVGRTIRDRIELSRRVRAQGVESNASVAVVMIISYVLAFLMWRTNPDRLEGFVQTAIGTTLVTGAVGLQAVGLVWMSKLSRSRF